MGKKHVFVANKQLSRDPEDRENRMERSMLASLSQVRVKEELSLEQRMSQLPNPVATYFSELPNEFPESVHDVFPVYTVLKHVSRAHWGGFNPLNIIIIIILYGKYSLGTP